MLDGEIEKKKLNLKYKKFVQIWGRKWKKA